LTLSPLIANEENSFVTQSTKHTFSHLYLNTRPSPAIFLYVLFDTPHTPTQPTPTPTHTHTHAHHRIKTKNIPYRDCKVRSKSKFNYGRDEILRDCLQWLRSTTYRLALKITGRSSGQHLFVKRNLLNKFLLFKF
jgi:hypothetical protein